MPLGWVRDTAASAKETRNRAVPDLIDLGRYGDGEGVAMSPNLLWIIAVIVAIIGAIVLISGSIVWGIVLLIVAALIGPGGDSIFRGRTR